MNIKKVKLLNFRNYKKLEISFRNAFNVIYGENGQGKTNILESIFLCASGRSHRTSKDADLIKMNEKFYYVKVELEKGRADSQIEINFDHENKKKIKINEIPVKRIGNLIGNLNVVIFSPEDLKVIKEGPSERRRFMDITISQMKPSYFYNLQQYTKILTQRNNLLKELQKNKNLIDTLDIWNNNLVDVGSKIIKTRNDFIIRLNKHVERKHLKLTGGNESLELKYAPSVKINIFENTEEISKKFLKALEISQNDEIKRCTTLYGPHRDDYDMYLNGVSLKNYGSQGQQRTSVLSIKLSEIDIMREETGEHPILLLDDVMSELDNKRQEFLLDNLKEIQTFITCTDIEFLKGNKNISASLYQVENGQIELKEVSE